MQTLETIKSRSQASVTNLVEKAKEQPEDVKTWGVTAAGAAVGAVALTAMASGVLAVLAAVAAPPVALTVGAVGGGLLGWNYMRNRQMTPPSFTPPPAPETSSVSEILAVADILPAADQASVAPTTPIVVDAVADAVPPAADSLSPTPPAENLEVIHGIGPVYAGRLRAAGIYTFADLAALAPDRIREIIGPTHYGQTADAERWIADAQQLSSPSTE